MESTKFPPADHGPAIDVPPVQNEGTKSVHGPVLVTVSGRKIKPLSADDRKNSNSDLHSRLKTRKLLGVGDDEGTVHFSKVSQILGHSEHLYLKLPRGQVYWSFANMVFFVATGFVALCFPGVIARVELGTEAAGDVSLAYRLYGTAMIGFAVIYNGMLATTDRRCIRQMMLSTAILLCLQFSVVLFGSKSYGGLCGIFILLRLVGAVVNFAYCELMGPSILYRFYRDVAEPYFCPSPTFRIGSTVNISNTTSSFNTLATRDIGDAAKSPIIIRSDAALPSSSSPPDGNDTKYGSGSGDLNNGNMATSKNKDL